LMSISITSPSLAEMPQSPAARKHARRDPALPMLRLWGVRNATQAYETKTKKCVRGLTVLPPMNHRQRNRI
jgi:hypothetical protein